MANTAKTAIVTGASHGIEAGLVDAFLQRGYSVVANSRHITKTNPFAYLVKASDNAEGVDSSVFEGIKNAIRADRASFTVDFLKNCYNYDVTAGTLVSDSVLQDNWNVAAGGGEIPGGPHGLCWTRGDHVNAELVPFVE